jgi:hypothetical protein
MTENQAEASAKAVLRQKQAAKRGAFQVWAEWGVIVSQQTGPPRTVTMKLGGSTVSVAGWHVLDQPYTYVVSDVVLVLKIGPDDWIVAGKRTP